MAKAGITKRITAVLTAVILAFCSLGTSTIVASAQSSTAPLNKVGIIGGKITTVRINDNKFNIIGDGSDACVSAGLWSYEIPTDKDIVSPKVNVSISNPYTESISDLSIDFYYINPESAQSYLKSKDASATEKLTNIDALATAANAGTAPAWLTDNFSCSDSNKIQSIAHNYTNGNNMSVELDLSEAVAYAKSNNQTSICLIAFNNKNNNGINNHQWSDSWVELSDITYQTFSANTSFNKSGIMTGGGTQVRYRTGSVFNIVNDGAYNTQTVGFWSYDLSSVKAVSSAQIGATVVSQSVKTISDLGIEFYAVNSSTVSDYLKDLSTSDKSVSNTTFGSNAGDGSVAWAKSTLGLSDSNKLGTLEHNYTSLNNKRITLDLSAYINSLKENGINEICIIALCNKNNNASATSTNWSDSWINMGNLYYDEIKNYSPLLKNGVISVGSTSGRYSGNTLNIVNDGAPNNTDIGLWSYDFTAVDEKKYPTVTATVTKWHTSTIKDFGIDFYYIDSAIVDDYLKELNDSSKGTTLTNSDGYTNDGAVDWYKTKLGLSESNKIATLEHNYTEGADNSLTLDLSSAVKTAKENNWSGLCILAMCSKNGNGNSSNSNWSDTWLTLGGITFGTNAVSQDAAQLLSAMKKFESKFSSGAIYTNMAPAYTAYVNCQKAYDAYVYGNSTSINLTTYTKALNDALGQMSVWSKPSSNKLPAFSSSDSQTLSTTTNCLWFEANNEPLAYGYNAEGCNVTAHLYYHNGVYLYTDSAPSIPFIVGFYRTNSSSNPQNPRVLYASLLSQSGGLAIKNAQYQGDICAREFATVMGKSYQINSSETATSSNIILSSGDIRYMANYFTINYQSAFASNSSYYVEAKPNTFKIGLGTKENGDTATITKNIENVGSRTFYVINYKPLFDFINSSTYKQCLKSISNYKQGGLEKLMQAYDAATAVNPADYDYSSSTSTKVSQCANSIKSAVEKFNNVGNLTTDNATYETLRNTIDSVRSIGSENTIISDDTTKTTRYTLASWNTYYNALSIAQNAMSNVLSADGYAEIYSEKSISQLAEDLTNGKDGLKYNYIVEYMNTAGQQMGSIIGTEGQTTSSNAVVNTQSVKGTQSRMAHIIYSWPQVTLSRDIYNDNEIITINEQKSEEACELVNGDIVTPATCTTPEVREVYCDICQGRYTVTGEKLNHSYVQTIIAPTCIEQGYTFYTCKNCGDSYKADYTPTIEHNYIETVVKPTCTSKGYTAKKCSMCQKEIIDENSYVEELGHEYTYEIIRDADCTFGGVGEYVCKRGDHSYTVELPTDDSIHAELAYSRTVAPTATESGYDIYYCTNLCGYWEKRNISPPTKTDAEFADYLEAYNAALQTIVEDLTPYTDESKVEYTSAVTAAKEAANKAIESNLKAELDKATQAIIEATALLRIKIISVRIFVFTADGEVKQISQPSQTASYGNEVNIDLSNDVDSEYVEKWTITKNGKTTKVTASQASYSMIADEDAVINVYLTDEPVEQLKQTKVTVLNNDSRVIAVDYVSDIKAIDLTSDHILKTQAPKIPFYSFAGWETVSSNEKELVVKATYVVI